MAKKKAKKVKGPKPDRLHIEGDWVAAVGKAINVKRPEEGWPEPEKKPRTRKK